MPHASDAMSLPNALRSIADQGFSVPGALLDTSPWASSWPFLTALRSSGRLTSEFASAIEEAETSNDPHRVCALGQFLAACQNTLDAQGKDYWPGRSRDARDWGTTAQLGELLRRITLALEDWAEQLYAGMSSEWKLADHIAQYPGIESFLGIEEGLDAAIHRARRDPFQEFDRMVEKFAGCGFVSSGHPGGVTGFFADPQNCSGDCRTLAEACCFALSAVEIEAEVVSCGPVLLKGGFVYGRTPNAINPGTGQTEWWIFAEHHWVSLGGVERDLLFGGADPAALPREAGAFDVAGPLHFTSGHLTMSLGADGIWRPPATGACALL